MPSLLRRCGFAVLFSVSLCLLVTRVGSQGAGVVRLTRTQPGTINLNPSMSGDGSRVAFETSADLAGVGAGAGLRLVSAETTQAPTFRELSFSRAPAPALSQDGTRAAFASNADPLGENRDGDSEIFLYDGARLRQLTHTTPDEPARRAEQGCFLPTLSDDGRLVAFTSDRDLIGENTGLAPQIYLSDTLTQKVVQISHVDGVVSARDAKLNGDGSRIAFVIDKNSEGAQSDLLVYSVSSGATLTAVSGVQSLALTFGRAASDDGLRVVYSARGTNGATQVFLFDERNGRLVRQLTQLGTRASDVPLNPSISGDGNRVVFATRRNVSGLNSDSGVELYLHDIPSNTTTRLTDAPAAARAEVVASLDDAGTRVVFNFARVLSEPDAAEEFENDSEIYLATIPARAPFATGLQLFNAAVPGKTPPAGALAQDSLAIITGKNLALSTNSPSRLGDGTFPTTVENLSATVGGRAAQIFYASPTQLNFKLPATLGAGLFEVNVRNPDGYEIRGEVNVAIAAPGIFTQSGTGAGEAVALDNATLRPSPFDVTDAAGDPRRVIIFCTGLRDARHVEALVGGRPARVEAVIPSPDLPGLDQLHLALSNSLRGAGTAALVVRADGAESNRATLTLTNEGPPARAARIEVSPAATSIPVGGEIRFKARVFDALGEEILNPALVFETADTRVAAIDTSGRAIGVSVGSTSVKVGVGETTAVATLRVVERTLVINEVLADPPDGNAGDANHDGVRVGAEEEFVELVNGSADVLDLSGWTFRTRPTGGSTESARHTFTQGSLLPPGEALALFGGGSPDPNDPIFGGALVSKASSGALSLSNAGLTLIVRDAAGNLVTQFTYGAAGDNFGGDAVNESITRSPDIEGAYARHTDADGSRRFSPGRRVDGGFFLERSGRLTRVNVSPLQHTLFIGESADFKAQAFDQYERLLKGVKFIFKSSDTSVAEVEAVGNETADGTVTFAMRGLSQGSTKVSAEASAGGVTILNADADLFVRQRPPKITRVEISSPSQVLNRGANAQLAARAFDENGQPVPDAPISWRSDDVPVATVDSNGRLRALGAGTVRVTATTPDNRGAEVSGQATFNVLIPLALNELLADVPPDDTDTAQIEGDANRDGTRNSDDDEFVELVNTSDAPLELSGLQIADATSVRFNIPEHTTLEAGRALVIFGGGAPPADAFGGALIFKSGSLSLNDGGDTLTVKLPLAADRAFVVATLAYGTGGTVAAPRDQSLTRSPDAGSGSAGGDFNAHTSAANSAGRLYSPGLRADGTPFGSPLLARVEVTPVTTTLDVGGRFDFSARALTCSNGVETEVPGVLFNWSLSDPKRMTVTPTEGTTVSVTAHASGLVVLNARAGGIEGFATINVNPTLTPTPSPTPTPTPTSEPSPTPTPSPSPTPTPTPSPTPGPKPLLVISQVFGGGGNSSAPYKNDFVEIFNRGGTEADLSGWSIQYSSAVGTTWQVTALPPVTLAPGRHLLIQQAGGTGCAGSPCGQDLPTPDAFGNVPLAANAGKVALVNTSDALSGACPVSQQVVDFIGYGPAANCFEGSGPAPAAGNTLSAFRKEDGCADSNDNANDFQAATPAPRNNASATTSCTATPTPTPTPLPTPSPSPTPTPTSTPTPTPSATPTPSTTPTPTPTTPLVVISQVYGGAGCTTANCSAFKNDFVELYNRGASAVSLNGWSVQYASATGTGTWQVTPLSDFTLAPGQHYLVQGAGNANGFSPLPVPDANGSTNLSATAGKVALVNTTTALTGACPTGASIVDLVGYGASANCSESAPAPAPGTNTSANRKGDGCTDTGNNSTDFATAPPNPRNSSAPTQACPSTPAQNETGEPSPPSEPALPLLFLIFDAYEFSEPRPSVGSKRWRRDALASFPRDAQVGRPRPRGAWP